MGCKHIRLHFFFLVNLKIKCSGKAKPLKIHRNFDSLWQQAWQRLVATNVALNSTLHASRNSQIAWIKFSLRKKKNWKLGKNDYTANIYIRYEVWVVLCSKRCFNETTNLQILQTQHEATQCILRQPLRTPHCLRFINSHLVWCQLLCAGAPNFNGCNCWITFTKTLRGVLVFSANHLKYQLRPVTVKFAAFLAHYNTTADDQNMYRKCLWPKTTIM